MNVRTACTALAAAACLTLGATACSSSSDSGSKPSPTKAGNGGGGSPEAACKAAMTKQVERLATDPAAVEEDAGTPKECRKLPTDRIKALSAKVMKEQTEKAARPKPLGTPQLTVGSSGTGKLEVTPTAVVYTAKAQQETSEKGTFAVVTVQDKATGDVAASEERLAGGGGWQWVAKDGTAVEFANTQAALGVGTESFTGGGVIQSGTKVWDSQTFDLTKAQAKGGTLMYVDGGGSAYKWKIPSDDSGPQAAQVRKELD